MHQQNNTAFLVFVIVNIVIVIVIFRAQAFVSCTLGAQMVAGALVGMALMQFIVSCTLSMLLRHVKRSAVLGK